MMAIYVFWIRQVVKYFRTPARVIGSLGQPLLFLISLGFGLSGSVGEVSGVTYFQYLVPGVVGLSVLFASMFSGIELISDRRFGFLKETLVAPVRRFWIFLGMSLGGATISTLQGLLVMLMSVLFGFRLYSLTGFIWGVLVMFLIAWIFTMLGLIMATKLRDFQSFPLIINFIIFPLFFLSGSVFPLENIPSALSSIVMLNPMTYGVDLLRSFFIGQTFFNSLTGVVVLITLASFLALLGANRFTKLTT